MFDRNIFGPYYDGAHEGGRFADPLAAYRELTYHTGGRLHEAWQEARDEAEVEKSYEAKGLLLAAGRATFGLAAFDPATGAGILDEDVWRVLDAFADFVDKKKVSTASLPSLSASTATGSCPTASTTGRTVACGSMPPASGCSGCS